MVLLYCVSLMEKTIGVIGIGNPLRYDDAIGIILLDFLKDHGTDFHPNVSFVDAGTAGMNVLHVISEFDIVLIIDAVQMGKAPGSWNFFSYGDVESQKEKEHISTHISDIFQVIELAKRIQKKPEKIYIFGIEPADLSIGQGLSKQVKDNLSTLQEMVKEKLSWMIDSLLS